MHGASYLLRPQLYCQDLLGFSLRLKLFQAAKHIIQLLLFSCCSNNSSDRSNSMRGATSLPGLQLYCQGLFRAFPYA